MTKQEFKQALADFLRDDTTQIYGGNDESPFVAQTFTIDLSTAKSEQDPFIIGFPFKTIVIKGAATDSTSTINVKFNKNDSGISTVPMIVNDVLNANVINAKAFLSWSAQAGKTITVIVYLHANYSSGSLVNSGSVSVSPSSGFKALANPALGAATAAVLIASNVLAKRRTLQNNDTASIWIGPSNVTNAGATRGIELLTGSSTEISSSAAIYGYSVAGFAAGGITVLEET